MLLQYFLLDKQLTEWLTKNRNMARESSFIYLTNILLIYCEPKQLYKEVPFCTHGIYTLAMNQIHKNM